MDITVLICTWNRAESLRECLTSLTKLIIPPRVSWEIIVVNNAATDNTDQVAKEFTNKLPVKILEEPELGLSKARNRGILSAKGKLVVFFDDDVIVDPNCLMAFLRAQLDFPQSSIFGGYIEPKIEEKCIKKALFLTDSFFDGLILRKNLGPVARVMHSNEYFFGANFAAKREVFQGFQFETSLGKKGNIPLCGEEVYFQKVARVRNMSIAWIPLAKVTHPISAERLSYRRMGRYFLNVGRITWRLEQIIFPPKLKTFSALGFWSQSHFLMGAIYEKYWSQLAKGN